MSTPLERRQRRRYSIEFGVQFAIVKNGKILSTGKGTIRDVSAGGIFFEPVPMLALDPGNVIHLVAKWPVRYKSTTRVDWIMDGIVVRSDGRGVAVEVLKQHLERRVRAAAEKQVG